MLGQDRQGPLRGGGEKAIIMRVDAHLEQAGQEQETHGKPRDGLQPFLDGFDEGELIGGFERFCRCRQDQDGNGNNAADPRDAMETRICVSACGIHRLSRTPTKDADQSAERVGTCRAV